MFAIWLAQYESLLLIMRALAYEFTMICSTSESVAAYDMTSYEITPSRVPSLGQLEDETFDKHIGCFNIVFDSENQPAEELLRFKPTSFWTGRIIFPNANSTNTVAQQQETCS